MRKKAVGRSSLGGEKSAAWKTGEGSSGGGPWRVMRRGLCASAGAKEK